LPVKRAKLSDAQRLAALQKLAVEISACRICDSYGLKVSHSQPMARGSGRIGIVVGIQPGNTEIKTAAAFTGPAGKRLMAWLNQAGVGSTREEILESFYFTRVRTH
jgi:uracil-DNA glycosylase